MKAFTLRPPWPLCIFRFDKRIENRTWRPSSVVGKRIAIHNGKRNDEGAPRYLKWLVGIDVDTVDPYPPGAIVGTVIIDGFFRMRVDNPEARSKWAIGPFCWRLRDAQELPVPIVCRGRQGLWEVPEDIYQRMYAQRALTINLGGDDGLR